MSRKEQKRVKKEKNRRVFLSLFLLLISIVIITGFSLGFFSDFINGITSTTAGNLKLDFIDKEEKQYYVTEDIEYCREESDIESIKPGHIIEFGYKAINLGNKSAFVKTIITITVTGDSIPEDILNYLYLFQYDANNPEEQRVDIRDGILNGVLELILIDDTVPGVQKYEYIMGNDGIMILNGKEGLAGQEVEEYGIDEFLAKYLLYFDSTAGAEYQGISIAFDVQVEAVQYRNNKKEGWALDLPEPSIYEYTGSLEKVTLTPGTYIIECWGASGANGNPSAINLGGKGAYTKGNLKITVAQDFWIAVGGEGTYVSTINAGGGWNGGGHAQESAGSGGGGGGATDIRTAGSDSTPWNDFNSLKSRIMVAGGGRRCSKLYNLSTLVRRRWRFCRRKCNCFCKF